MSLEPLNHIDAIRDLLITITVFYERMHALIVEGPPGWGKTTAVEDALKSSGIQAVRLGSYSTPLNLFNFLHGNPDRVIVIDDCAGLFSDQSSMALLKAATWGIGKKRTLRWGSTSGKANTEEFNFCGKLIIACNTFPYTADAIAVKSRSFPYKIRIDLTKARDLLVAAATNQNLFSDTKIASLIDRGRPCDRLLQSRAQTEFGSA